MQNSDQVEVGVQRRRAELGVRVEEGDYRRRVELGRDVSKQLTSFPAPPVVVQGEVRRGERCLP